MKAEIAVGTGGGRAGVFLPAGTWDGDENLPTRALRMKAEFRLVLVACILVLAAAHATGTVEQSNTAVGLPLQVYLLTDTSPSTKEVAAELQTVARAAINALIQGDRFRLLSAHADRPRVRAIETIGPDKRPFAEIDRALEDIRPALLLKADLAAALQIPLQAIQADSTSASRTIIFVFTDGKIGNEQAERILARVQEIESHEGRVIVTGVDGANRSLLVAAAQGRLRWWRLAECDPGRLMAEFRKPIGKPASPVIPVTPPTPPALGTQSSPDTTRGSPLHDAKKTAEPDVAKTGPSPARSPATAETSAAEARLPKVTSEPAKKASEIAPAPGADRGLVIESGPVLAAPPDRSEMAPKATLPVTGTAGATTQKSSLPVPPVSAANPGSAAAEARGSTAVPSADSPSCKQSTTDATPLSLQDAQSDKNQARASNPTAPPTSRPLATPQPRGADTEVEASRLVNKPQENNRGDKKAIAPGKTNGSSQLPQPAASLPASSSRLPTAPASRQDAKLDKNDTTNSRSIEARNPPAAPRSQGFAAGPEKPVSAVPAVTSTGDKARKAEKVALTPWWAWVAGLVTAAMMAGVLLGISALRARHSLLRLSVARVPPNEAAVHESVVLAPSEEIVPLVDGAVHSEPREMVAPDVPVLSVGTLLGGTYVRRGAKPMMINGKQLESGENETVRIKIGDQITLAGPDGKQPGTSFVLRDVAQVQEEEKELVGASKD